MAQLDEIFALACPHCGSQMSVRGPARLVRGRCSQCGREVVIKVEESDPTRGILLPTARVAIQLTPGPLATELVALRRLVPELRNESLADLRARLANRTEWVLNAVPQMEIETLQQQAHDSGISLVVTAEEVPIWRRVVGQRVRLSPSTLRITIRGG